MMVADMERWNAIPYGSTLLPQYEFLGRGKPPKTAADWAGLRVRAGGGVGQAMELLGATRQTVPGGRDLHADAARRGRCGQLPVQLCPCRAYKIDELSEWFTGNLQPGTSECPIVFNKKAFDALPDQYKDLLMSLKDEATAGDHRGLYRGGRQEPAGLPREDGGDHLFGRGDSPSSRNWPASRSGIKWIADNKDKFDSQALFDRMMELLAEAQAKYQN